MAIDINAGLKKIREIISSTKTSISGTFGKTTVSGTFGLDIGNFSVKAAEIKKKSQLKFAVGDIAEEGQKETVIFAIKQCLRSSGIASQQVNLSLSGTNIITRYMLMPKMSQKELISSLEFELVKHIPTRLEDMLIDYQIIDRALDGQMLVLVVGAEKRIIAEKVELVKQAGLTARSINVDCFAALEAFQRVGPLSFGKDSGSIALLDLGHRASKLVVLEAKLVRFSRDIILGGYDLTKVISERMNIDLKSAKELKHKADISKSEEAATIMSSSLNSILDEIRLSFDYCERLTQKKISRMYLCGGGARLKGIEGFFASGLEIEVKPWNPLENSHLTISIPKEEIETNGLLSATAIGLAL